ncbi:MAG: hypothetical protein KKA31_02625 [Candidatus Margulisbacteria bacterium]|nr:hypothetical protein [Candidatus Margulisiibacteriota bacterium]
MKKNILVILIWIFICLTGMAFAQEKKLTKGEAVMKISTTDFVKKKIGELLSWTVGYDISNVSRVKLTPTINYVRAVPKKVPPDGRTVLEIVASVDDPGGLKNIAGVRADLSSIGRLPNTMLVDNGLFGDAKAEDGVYTLQSKVAAKTKNGTKDLPVAVANKKGWLALAKTSLVVERDPVIAEVSLMPEKISAGRKSYVTLTVKVDNPGRIEDIEEVTVDLRSLGHPELAVLRNDGKAGDAVAGDDVFSLQFLVDDFVKSGEYDIRIGASNLSGGYGFTDIVLKVE